MSSQFKRRAMRALIDRHPDQFHRNKLREEFDRLYSIEAAAAILLAATADLDHPALREFQDALNGWTGDQDSQTAPDQPEPVTLVPDHVRGRLDRQAEIQALRDAQGGPVETDRFRKHRLSGDWPDGLALARAIRDARVEREVSVMVLAQRLNWSPAMVSDVERGLILLPPPVAKRWAEAIGLDPDDLYDRSLRLFITHHSAVPV